MSITCTIANIAKQYNKLVIYLFILTCEYISKCNIGPICHFKHIMHEKRKKENNTESSGKQRYDWKNTCIRIKLPLETLGLHPPPVLIQQFI